MLDVLVLSRVVEGGDNSTGRRAEKLSVLYRTAAAKTVKLI